MEEVKKLILIYLAIMNILAFVIFGYDKWQAIRHRWRISEMTLLFCAGAGGAFGALIGMGVFHHKTKKRLFNITIPLFTLVWLIVIRFIKR